MAAFHQQRADLLLEEFQPGGFNGRDRGRTRRGGNEEDDGQEQPEPPLARVPGGVRGGHGESQPKGARKSTRLNPVDRDRGTGRLQPRGPNGRNRQWMRVDGCSRRIRIETSRSNVLRIRGSTEWEPTLGKQACGPIVGLAKAVVAVPSAVFASRSSLCWIPDQTSVDSTEQAGFGVGFLRLAGSLCRFAFAGSHSPVPIHLFPFTCFHSPVPIVAALWMGMPGLFRLQSRIDSRKVTGRNPGRWQSVVEVGKTIV